VVVDLTHHIAGPYCTKMLADYGAEVIKVERPGLGDPTRRAGPFPGDLPDMEKSGLFLYLNTNKKGITLNLKSTMGKAILKRLVAMADLVVESFSPRVMPSLGLGYEELVKVRPGLIMTSISSFGQTGPYRDYRASEIVAYAMGGSLYLIGEPDRVPLKGPLAQAQYLTGLFACGSTLAAILRRARMGSGDHVDVSIMEAVAAVQESTTTTYAYSGTVWRRAGSRRPEAHPWTILPCRDGYVVVGVSTPVQWEMMTAMLDMPELAEDPRFATAQRRFQHADELDAILSPWFKDRTKQEIYELAQLWRVPFSPVPDLSEVASSPQLAARRYFETISHPVAGVLPYAGAPFRLGVASSRAQQPAPLLGQHNVEIYCKWLGFSKQDLVRLREQGVI